eukprot:TRINITY_DN7295_c0_g1_i1.p2 TRINITY_DN7295_c0_g1~~TRINITY_DN7295_c0_g1_i1.p2  ORF type:complete len:120 (+),score=49.20 TRINITY_DN7295_c0_g1_i1:61-420(+)
MSGDGTGFLSGLAAGQQAIDSEHSMLEKKIPAELHITRALGQHPYHPYDPEMDPARPCVAENGEFFECMEGLRDSGWLLHQKHVECFTQKTELMRCLVREKKAARAAAAAAAAAASGKD